MLDFVNLVHEYVVVKTHKQKELQDLDKSWDATSIEFEVKRQESREQGSEERLNSAVEGEKTPIQSEALGTRTPDTVTVTFCTSWRESDALMDMERLELESLQLSSFRLLMELNFGSLSPWWLNSTSSSPPPPPSSLTRFEELRLELPNPFKFLTGFHLAPSHLRRKGELNIVKLRISMIMENFVRRAWVLQ
jgi:hypothetical protein